MNTLILDFLNSYADNTNPQYAVMLKGKWGCGKTHLIKEWIETDPASHCSGTASTQGKHRLFCRWNYRLLPLLFNPMCIVYAAFLRTFRILKHGKAVNP